jgi:hypothetical protein
MKNADCDRVRPLLSARLDRELTDQTERDVSAHLTACPACDEELRHIERGRQLVALLPVAAPPASLRRDVLQRLAQQARAPRPHRVWRRPAFALATLAVILLGTAGAWQWSTMRSDAARASSAGFTVGNPLHLERLTNAVGTPREFHALAAQHELREVNVEEALARASFKVLCPLQAEPGQTLDDRHLTELRTCPLVHLSSLRGDHRIVLLQQPADWPIVYGGAPVEHVTIAGQPCDRLHIRGHEIIKWERGGTRSIIVAVAANPEITKVARALISASS